MDLRLTPYGQEKDKYHNQFMVFWLIPMPSRPGVPEKLGNMTHKVEAELEFNSNRDHRFIVMTLLAMSESV